MRTIVQRYDEVLCDKAQKHQFLKLETQFQRFSSQHSSQVKQLEQVINDSSCQIALQQQRQDFLIDLIDQTKDRLNEFEPIRQFQTDLFKQLQTLQQKTASTSSLQTDLKSTIASCQE